jgi:hypothetical protein
MHLRKTQAIKFLPLIFIIFMISCHSDMVSINSNSNYYSVNTGGNSTKSNVKFITGFLPVINEINYYNEKFIIQDRFLSQEKEIVAASDAGFVLINAKNNYIKNEKISLTIAGSPNTVYSLKIRYKSGYSTAKGLGNVTSDKNGYAIWSFKIGNISSSDDFVPWFEVSDGLIIIKHYFNIGDTNKLDIIKKEEVITAVNQETNSDENKITDIADVTEKVSNIDKESSIESTTGQTETETTDETETQKVVEQETTSPMLKVNFINARDIYYRGENVTLIISGKANTVYTLKIKYKSGYSTAKGLGDTQSDASGVASWKFKISTNADINFLPWFEVSSEGAVAILNFKLADVPETEHETNAQTTEQQETIPDTQPETQVQTSQDSNSEIVFIDNKQTYSKSDLVTLTIKGLPETVYTLKIKYKSGYSTAQGLGNATSGKDGIVSWSFKIGSRVNTADFTPFFEVTGGGETAIRYFEVVN